MSPLQLFGVLYFLTMYLVWTLMVYLQFREDVLKDETNKWNDIWLWALLNSFIWPWFAFFSKDENK